MSLLAHTLLCNFLMITIATVAQWTISLIRRDASIADVFWGFGFVIVAWMSWFDSWLDGSRAGPRIVLLTTLTTIWGLRLSLFLLWRNLGHGEDRRYSAMRVHHGVRFWWVSLFTVFLLQGAILWFVSLPIQCAAALKSGEPLGWLDAAGVSIWIVGMFFETVGDWQLARFKANPANSRKVMDRGLWRYTRHPNYFGDFCVWWGIYLIAAAGGAWLTILSPILMATLLIRVSGVRLLESTIANRRPEYAAYVARANAFFPGPRHDS